MPADKIVRVGVAVLVWKRPGELLLGHRIGDHGGGTWSFPGGHMEYGEQPIETARRELDEEIGTDCRFSAFRQYKPCPYVNTLFSSGKHYITLFFEASLAIGEPKVMEPNKCAEWRWFWIDQLPAPLFEPIDPKILDLSY